ncbi:hypothetical protein KUCAC02_029222, partial [Chaenocephalus aceratus]
MAQTDIQLFELYQRTRSQWFSRRQKDRGGCLSCFRELASSLQQLWLSSLSRQRKGCRLYSMQP